MVSRLFLKKKSLSIFEIFRGNFFGQIFFYFLDVSGETTHFGGKKLKKKNL